MNSDIVITIKISGEANQGGVQVGEIGGVPTPSEVVAGLGAAATGVAPSPEDLPGVGDTAAAGSAVPSPLEVEGEVAGVTAGPLPTPVGLDQIEQLTTSIGLSSSEDMIPEPEGNG